MCGATAASEVSGEGQAASERRGTAFGDVAALLEASCEILLVPANVVLDGVVGCDGHDGLLRHHRHSSLR